MVPFYPQLNKQVLGLVLEVTMLLGLWWRMIRHFTLKFAHFFDQFVIFFPTNQFLKLLLHMKVI